MSIHLPQPKPDPTHYLALDGWRGICACMVAMFHFRAFSHITESDFIKSGGSFLDFFFVLSGFVIFANYYERLKAGYSLKNFMILRFGRLYPLHFFVLFIFLSGDLLQLILPFLSKGAIYPPFHGPYEGPRYILANLFMIHSFGVTDALSYNAPSWSISAEFYTYLVYALAIVWGRKRPVVIGLTLFMFVFMIVFPERMGGTANFGIIRCIYGFGCGGVTWMMYRHFKGYFEPLSPLFFNTAELILFIGAFAYVYGILLFNQAIPYILVFSPWMFSLTVFVFAFQKGFVSRILMSRVFALLGVLSYSIYMLHILISGKVFYGVGHIVEKIMGIKLYTSADGIDKIGTNPWMGDAICVIYLITVIACSYITYSFIELPCRNFARRFVRKAHI